MQRMQLMKNTHMHLVMSTQTYADDLCYKQCRHCLLLEMPSGFSA